MRSRAWYPDLLKTLFLLEHLPEPSSCGGSLLVLGLVLKRVWIRLAVTRRLAAAGWAGRLQTRFTQSISLSNIQTLSLLSRRPALGRSRNLPGQSRKTGRPVSRSASPNDGGDLETANEFGGADRDRTGDPLLAKQVLSQLSYSPTCGCLRLRWWAWVESNYRPHPYQGCALTN